MFVRTVTDAVRPVNHQLDRHIVRLPAHLFPHGMLIPNTRTIVDDLVLGPVGAPPERCRRTEPQTNRLPMTNMALMAEPDPAADEFIAPTQSETVAAPTAAAPAADRQSWRATWRQAAAILMGALALAGAIIVAFWVLAPATKDVGSPSTALPAPTPAPTATATASAPAGHPPSIASTPDQDNTYVQALKDRGISFANPEAAIYNGKLVCDDIRLGMTVPQIVTAFRASNPALGGDADNYVAISVHAYCPQNGNLVSAGS